MKNFNKFTLVNESKINGVLHKVVHEFEYEQLGDVLERIREFLLGCGYQINGELVVLEDEPVVQLLLED